MLNKQENILLVYYTSKDFQSIYRELLKYRQKNKYINDISPMIVMCKSAFTKAIEENDIPLDKSICRFYCKLTTNLEIIKDSINKIDSKTIAQWKQSFSENKESYSELTNKDERSDTLLKNPFARFMIKDTYQIDGDINAENIEKFIKNVQSNQQAKFYPTKLSSLEKYSMKVTTNDFEAMILEKSVPSLVLYYNKCTTEGKGALREYENVLAKHKCETVNFYRMATYCEVYMIK
jgi:hypothetical protein